MIGSLAMPPDPSFPCYSAGMRIFLLWLLSVGSFIAAVQVLPRLWLKASEASLEPLREKETARQAAIELTLRAVQKGFIPAPRVSTGAR
jgi:hypothetical protein